MVLPDCVARLAASTTLCAFLAGCSGVDVRGGIPQIAKPSSGTLLVDEGGLPDLQRGNQARLDGRIEDAFRDLLPLAKRGYPEAQIALAQTFSLSDSLKSEVEAIHWYRIALAKQPEAGLALANALMRSSDRASAEEIRELIDRAEKIYHDPAAPAARLQFWTRYPQFEPAGEAEALAERLSKSELTEDRLVGIDWFRATVTEGNHVQRLSELCLDAVDIDLNCTVDLAHLYRYTGNRAALETHTDRSLAAFEKAGATLDFKASRQLQVNRAKRAAALARAMVDQPSAELAAEALQAYSDRANIDPNLEAEVTDALQGGRREEAIETLTAAATAAGVGIVTAPELADRVLRWMIKQGGSDAFEAAGVAVGYPYLLRDLDLAKVLETELESGNYRANLALGELYLFGQRATQDPVRAEKYFSAASEFRSTRAIALYRLGRLYYSGLLGRPEPRKTIDCLLAAARDGTPAAYVLLADTFFNAHGFKIDRVNALVFARRAADSGRPLILHSRVVARSEPAAVSFGAGAPAAEIVSYKLVDRLQSEMTPSELARAETIYVAERALRPVIRPPVTAEVWNRVRL